MHCRVLLSQSRVVMFIFDVVVGRLVLLVASLSLIIPILFHGVSGFLIPYHLYELRFFIVYVID